MNNNKRTSKKSPFGDLLPILIGEIAVAALVCLGFWLVQLLGIYTDFEYYKVPLGAALGVLVIIANHTMLIIAIDREIKKFIANRPKGEMSEEEIQLYAKKQSASIQNAMKVSSITRTVSMLVVLVIAFITKWFNPIATAIPMFAFGFILTASELIKSRKNPKPDPSKFIKYEDEDENTEFIEKEDN